MITSINALPLLNVKHQRFNNEFIVIMPFPNSYDESAIGTDEVYLGIGKNDIFKKHRQFKIVEDIGFCKFIHFIEQRDDGYYLSATHVKSPRIPKLQRTEINQVLVPILNHSHMTTDIWKSKLLFRAAFHNDDMISESLVYEACKNLLKDFGSSKMQTFTPTSKWLHNFSEINDLIDDAHIESSSIYELTNAIDRIIHFTFGKPSYIDDIEKKSTIINQMNADAKVPLEKILPKGVKLKITKNDEYVENKTNEELENSSNIQEIMNVDVHDTSSLTMLIVSMIEAGIERADITLKKDSKKDKLYITNGICYCNYNNQYSVVMMDNKTLTPWSTSALIDTPTNIAQVVTQYYNKNIIAPMKELDSFRFHYYDHAACVELKINNKVYRYVVPVLMNTSTLPVFHST